MVDGNIKVSGNYDLALEIEKEGYGKYTSNKEDNLCTTTIDEIK